MKQILAMLIVVLGLFICGFGMCNEGDEKLDANNEMEATTEAPPKDDFNFWILTGVVFMLGGTVYLFFPNRLANKE